MLGLDVSVYSGEITADKWRQIKALGYEVAIIGLFHGQTANRYANRQCFAAKEAGMITAGYIYLAPWTGKSGEEQVLVGLDTVGELLAKEMCFVAIDCECDGITKEMIWQAVDTVRAKGLRAIIYTARWWWKDHFGDPHDFAGVPLWSAYYDNDPDLDFPKMPYGNWEPTLHVGVRAAQTTGIMGEQYQGTTYICGINCDLNWFDERFIREEENDMGFEETDQNRLKAVENLVNRIYEQGRDNLVQPEGRGEIYIASVDELVHVSNPSVQLGNRFDPADVQVLKADNPIFRLPTTFPGGVPELK